MIRFTLRSAAGLILATLPISAQATVIDFSGYKEGATYQSGLAIDGATFSAIGGVLKIVNLGAGNSLCAFDGFSCSGGLSIKFTQGGAKFGFTFSGDTLTDYAVFWQGETPFLSFVGAAYGDGNPTTVHQQNFLNSRFDDLTRINITPARGSDIGFNGFAFDPTAAVPEPATWAMMLAGFGAVGFALRRRRPSEKVGACPSQGCGLPF